MINLHSIFKSRDITLPTKVHLVKAMVFPVVMYGCESWTVKKAERQRNDAFELWFGEGRHIQPGKKTLGIKRTQFSSVQSLSRVRLFATP